MTRLGLLPVGRVPNTKLVFCWNARDMTATPRVGGAPTITSPMPKMGVRPNGQLGYTQHGRPAWTWTKDPVTGLFTIPGAAISLRNGNVLGVSSQFDHASFSNVNTPTLTTNNVAGPDGAMTADTIADTESGAPSGRRTSSFAVGNDANPYCASVFVKKTTGAQNHVVALTLSLTGGTGVNVIALINTTTGGMTGTAGLYGLVDESLDYWRIFVRAVNNTSGNNGADITVYPAYRSDLTGTTAQNSAQGSHAFWGLQFQSSIVTPSLHVPTTGGSFTDAGDNFEWPLLIPIGQIAGWGGFTWFEEYIARQPLGATLSDASMIGNDDAAGTSGLMMSVGSAAPGFTARWQTPGGNGSSVVAAASYGPNVRVERRVTVSSTGVCTGYITLDLGAEAAGNATSALGFPAAWNDAVISLGDQNVSNPLQWGHRVQLRAGLAQGIVTRDDMRAWTS